MEKQTRTEWLCSDPELYLLAGLLGCRGLVGVADPFPGFLAEDVQEQVKRLKDQLLARGLLVGTNDSFVIDESLLPLVRTIAFPQMAYWVTDSGSVAPWQGHVYVGESLVAAKTAADTNGQHRVYPMGTPEEEQATVLARFAVADEEALPFAEAVISQATSERAIAMSCNGSADVSALTALFATEGLPEAHADALARSLAAPSHLGQWVRMEPVGGGWEVHDIGFCCSGNGHWLLRFSSRGEKRLVEFRPASGAQVKQALADFLQVKTPTATQASQR